MDYIICKPVMLAGNGPIFNCPEGMFIREVNIHIRGLHQHLYLVSGEELKANDWYIHDGFICKTFQPVFLSESLNKEVLNIKTRNKIVATTEKSFRSSSYT